jgi:hypothetical protein
MNNDYVGEQKGRCSNYGFDKNEVRFGAVLPAVWRGEA